MMASETSLADVPSWAKKNTTKKSGNSLNMVCEGTGPSASLARREAISNCQVSAKQFLDNEIKIKTLSVETEFSVGFHQEVEESGSVRDLVCNPKRDEVIEKNEQYQVWLECQFDLNKAKVEPKANKELRLDEDKAPHPGLESMTPAKVKKTDVDHQALILESVPQCDSVIIRGVKPRTIPCQSNPMKIVVEDTDKEIIVRANKFQPKTITIPKGGSNETIQVFLERN